MLHMFRYDFQVSDDAYIFRPERKDLHGNEAAQLIFLANQRDH